VPSSRTLTAALGVLFCLTSGVAGRSSQDRPASPIEPGRPIEAELAGGGAHSYTFTLHRGELLDLVIDQRGIDVIVKVLGPDGTTMVEANTPIGGYGLETIAAIAGGAGLHRLEIRAAWPDAAAAQYHVRLAPPRPATEQDLSRVQAVAALSRAETLRSKGTAESFQESLTQYQQALALFEAAGDRGGEGDALLGIGRVEDSLGERRKALETFAAALAIHRSAGRRGAEGLTLNFMGLTHDLLGDRRRALEYFGEALTVARAAGDRRTEALALGNTGFMHYNLGDKDRALAFAFEALPLHRAVDNRRAVATTHSLIGMVYDSMGEKRKALDYLEQGLHVRQRLGEPREEGIILNNIGFVYRSMDAIGKAIEYYDQALPRFRVAGDRLGEGATLSNMGSIYTVMGDRQRALEVYTQALALHRSINYRTGEAIILNALGSLHSTLGDRRRARSYYEQSLPLHRAVGNRSSEAAALGNIGSSLLHEGDVEKALAFQAQALELARLVKDPIREADALANLASAHSTRRDYPQALEYQTQALERQRTVGSVRGEGLALAQIGVLNAAMGHPEKALAFYAQALPRLRAAGDVSGAAFVLSGVARAEDSRGNLDTAREAIDDALELTESVRGRVASPALRASYLASVRGYYELEIDILMALHRQRPFEGYDARALQASERARARSLLEIVNEGGVDIRQGADAALLARERELRHDLNAKADRQARLLAGKHSEDQAAAASRGIDAVMAEYEQVEARVRASSPNYAALTHPQPLSLADIQRDVLDADTLLLEYAVTDARGYLWVVSPTSIASFELPPRDQIEQAVRRFYESTQSGPASAAGRDAGSALSEMLLAPAKALLRSQRLVIVADGALQYVPFAALPSPHRTGEAAGHGSPLIVSHEIVSLPSASVLAVLRREAAQRERAPRALFVVADPVFSADDARVKAAATRSVIAVTPPVGQEPDDGLRFPRLIGSRREASGILAMVPEHDRRQAFDFDATRTKATSADLLNYRVVHLATHGFLDSAHPELSGLVLSLVDRSGAPQDGFLRVHDIYNLRLRADLVVLSACQTALGKEIRGEGLVGLTRGFMYAGAPRVVASLWKVDDRATAELMKELYQKMLGPERLRPAAALRAAQVSLVASKRWQDPYYWAAFTLHGEWR
jgi:CHAT domain-containing protein/Tfp pilus assembly protein PilF